MDYDEPNKMWKVMLHKNEQLTDVPGKHLFLVDTGHEKRKRKAEKDPNKPDLGIEGVKDSKNLQEQIKEAKQQKLKRLAVKAHKLSMGQQVVIHGLK